MANDADDLLQAEQAVQDVLKELEALKRQVSGYDTAKQSLEGVRQALDSLIAKTSALAEQTHAVTATLSKIGTPELLSRAESLKEGVAALAADIPKQSERVRSVALAGLIVSAVSLIGVIVILVKLFLR
jgi:cell division septum initiation protein DivIVA